MLTTIDATGVGVVVIENVIEHCVEERAYKSAAEWALCTPRMHAAIISTETTRLRDENRLSIQLMPMILPRPPATAIVTRPVRGPRKPDGQ